VRLGCHPAIDLIPRRAAGGSLNETTLPDTSSENAEQRSGPPLSPVLVLAWSSDELERIGEVAVPPPGTPGDAVVWGRAGAGGAERRLLLQRQRPGRTAVAGEVSSPKVSRSQLRVEPISDRALQITNLGRSSVLHNGEDKASFQVCPGDVIEVGRQLVLLCVRRPAWLAGPPLDDSFPFGGVDPNGIVGESAEIWELRRRLAFIASRDGHVLVGGESGTGKELVARALHERSARGSRPLVARNAATLPDGIVDAELFGNQKNYPNPGMPERPGMVGEADGSTLFLDEIAEVSTALQAHLLRLLDSGEYHRLGEARARRADLRLVGATNRPDSALKHDLLARFAFRLRVPSLNERREDIPLLLVHLLRQIAARDSTIAGRFFSGAAPRISPAFVRALLRHPFSTNVRELNAILWQALADSPGDRIEAPAGLGDHVPEADERTSDPGGTCPIAPANDAPPGLSPAAIQARLDAHNGVIEDAWRSLGLSSRHALARLIKKHDLEIRKKAR
jgi:DNA-binding NtrC family response regulator